MKRNGYSRLLWLLTSIVVFVLVGAEVTARAAFSDLNLVTAIQDVAKRAIPSVVHIEVIEKQTVHKSASCHFKRPIFSDIFSEIPAGCRRTLRKGSSGPWERDPY